MKKTIMTVAIVLTCTCAGAQEKKQNWINNVKLSGYTLLQYQYNDKENAESNSFNLRMARLSLDGRILNDFYWKAQIQFNGNTSQLGSSPKVVDLFTEWQKHDFAKIKFGQFKRPFTFENPMNPIDQGFMSYGQAITNLAGFNDRNGSHSSNGRDIGVQLQGDLLPNASNRKLLHYQVGVFNGQGINVNDVDQRKDIIGGLWIMPISGMRIGAFGWTGSYARKGNWTTTDGTTHTAEVRSLPQRRYAISAEYCTNDWTIRSEYIHSTGHAFKTRYQKTEDATDCTLSANGDKSEGIYALVIAPIVKNKYHAKARYDMFRPSRDASKQKTQYEIGVDCELTRNFKISVEYALVNDHAIANSDKHNYNMIDFEVAYRF